MAHKSLPVFENHCWSRGKHYTVQTLDLRDSHYEANIRRWCSPLVFTRTEKQKFKSKAGFFTLSVHI